MLFCESRQQQQLKENNSRSGNVAFGLLFSCFWPTKINKLHWLACVCVCAIELHMRRFFRSFDRVSRIIAWLSCFQIVDLFDNFDYFLFIDSRFLINCFLRSCIYFVCNQVIYAFADCVALHQVSSKAMRNINFFFYKYNLSSFNV